MCGRPSGSKAIVVETPICGLSATRRGRSSPCGDRDIDHSPRAHLRVAAEDLCEPLLIERRLGVLSHLLRQRSAGHLDRGGRGLGELDRVADAAVVDEEHHRREIEEVLVEGHEHQPAAEEPIDERLGLVGKKRQVGVEDRPSRAQRLKVELVVELPRRLERKAARPRDVQILTVLLDRQYPVHVHPVGLQDLLDLGDREAATLGHHPAAAATAGAGRLGRRAPSAPRDRPDRHEAAAQRQRLSPADRCSYVNPFHRSHLPPFGLPATGRPFAR